MCQLHRAMVPRYLVKCYSGWFCEGGFRMTLCGCSSFHHSKILIKQTDIPLEQEGISDSRLPLNLTCNSFLGLQLLASPADFGPPRLHKCVTQFLKVNLSLSLCTLGWFYFSKEFLYSKDVEKWETSNIAGGKEMVRPRWKIIRWFLN